MNQYLLSTYDAEDQTAEAPSTPIDMQSFMQRVMALEAEMDASGTFVFGGALYGPDASTVVRAGDSGAILMDGPFVESKEHIAGFYIINANDLDAALVWAQRVVQAINHPIEVRPFRATGFVKDSMGPGA